MRAVSMVFQRVIADRPAISASRKPSSVSATGVLMDMPVMTIRSPVDKEHLHDAERTRRVATQHLAGADRGVVVEPESPADQRQVVARPDRLVELRSVDFYGAGVTRRGRRGDLR